MDNTFQHGTDAALDLEREKFHWIGGCWEVVESRGRSFGKQNKLERGSIHRAEDGLVMIEGLGFHPSG